MRVMPYSWACETPLSNFETRLDNSYRERADKSVTVSFKITDCSKLPNQHQEYRILAWTTTPWTLPSNLFLAVNPKMNYVLIRVEKDEEREYILAEALLKDVAGKMKIEGKYEIIEKYKGEELAGLEYEPLFTEFYNKFHSRGCFKVYTADYVSSVDGTAIVHNAPGFGEDDYNVGEIGRAHV